MRLQLAGSMPVARMRWSRRWRAAVASLATLASGAPPVPAAVLSADRADAMYHYYDGGGTEVHGPALLVRKSMGESVSVSADYYQDAISGASIDVVTTASPYKDKRDQIGVGIDLLRRNTLFSVNYSKSEESDYLADTFALGASHEMFDGMTTVNLGYRLGHDDVMKNNSDFQDVIDRYQYSLGISQVLSRRFVMWFDYEGTLEDGYLNSPYRAARLNGLLVPENYPRTRDGNALVLRGVYGLTGGDGPLVSSVRAGYRFFWDTWDIQSSTIDLAYQRYVGANWLLEANFRYYTQSAAVFYSDNFTTPQVYMARDKELSTFASYGFGMKATWWFYRSPTTQRRASLNLSGNHVLYDYQDFTDVRDGQPYSFSANILQLFVSLWY